MRETFLSLLSLPHPPSKISSSLAPKEGLILRLPLNILDERNGYPEIFSFSQALEIYRQYLLLRTVILQKKVAAQLLKIWRFPLQRIVCQGPRCQGPNWLLRAC